MEDAGGEEKLSKKWVGFPVLLCYLAIKFRVLAIFWVFSFLSGTSELKRRLKAEQKAKEKAAKEALKVKFGSPTSSSR